MKNLMSFRILCLGVLVFVGGCTLESLALQGVNVGTNVTTNTLTNGTNIVTNVVTNITTNTNVTTNTDPDPDPTPDPDPVVPDTRTPQAKFLDTLKGKHIIVKDIINIKSSGTFSSDGKTLTTNEYSSYVTSAFKGNGNSGSFAALVMSNAASPYPFQIVADTEGLVGSYYSDVTKVINASTTTRLQVNIIITLNAARTGGTLAAYQHGYQYFTNALVAGYPVVSTNVLSFTLSDNPSVSN